MKILHTLGLFISIAVSAAGELSLPDPLTTQAGVKIATPAEWQSMRRAEILELFRENVYGRAPVARPENLLFDVIEVDKTAMNGKATLKRIEIRLSGRDGKERVVIPVSVFIPNHVTGPAPAFLLICNRYRSNIDPTRKKISPFWPAERIIERGYVAATFHYSDVALDDKADGYKSGVFGLYDPEEGERAPDAWGAIAAWAWGASRVMDYFETDKAIDQTRVAVVGHSRGGKAALWCGAEDERFAMVISNNSGCTGAALSRRAVGESVAKINRQFPHWFCANYKAFNANEDKLPIDQHQLIALIAPRFVYVSSATQDEWADPEGEFLSCVHAGPVYRLFGLQGVGADTFPKPEMPLHVGHIGYHLRTGKHDLTEYDWDRFMDFSDKKWKLE